MRMICSWRNVVASCEFSRASFASVEASYLGKARFGRGHGLPGAVFSCIWLGTRAERPSASDLPWCEAEKGMGLWGGGGEYNSLRAEEQ